jgi:peptidyl-dipeptidase Dcp
MLTVKIVEGIHIPDFSQLTPEAWDAHLEAAFNKAQEAGLQIANCDEEANFTNTFLAMERRTKDIWAVFSPFGAVQGADNTPAMQELAKKWRPQFDDLENRFLDANLAARCQHALDTATYLDDIDRRLCEETLRKFKRAGAFLNGPDQERFLAISQELSTAGLDFAEVHQNNSNRIVLVDATLPGVDLVFVEQARQAASVAGHAGKAAVAMNASEVDAVLGQCSDRETRKLVWDGYAGRGLGVAEGDTSTQPLLARILELRQELATLLGFEQWGELATSERMAKTPQTALALVENTWAQLHPVFERDRDVVLAHAQDNGFEGALQPWDLDYWLGQTRAAQFSIDDEKVRRHLPLPIVRAGAFASAEALFGITFEAVDAPTYHTDARPFLVRDRDSSVLGLLYIDDAIRETKSSGAWMEMLLPADRIDGGTLPIISNVCNFPSASDGRPSLLSMDEAVTAFHELGHALHGLMTTARYPSQAGTMVYGDFVELQSQLLENWIREPEALSRIGLDWETGQKMDLELAQQVNRAMQFGQSFDKARYLMSAWLDLAAHADPKTAGEDPTGFENSVLASMDAPALITPRHRLPHFTHLFAGVTGEQYSAGYYSYLWAEVLEADAFEAWKESGNLFDDSLGQKARATIYARGNEVAPDELYRHFRGHDPDPRALLRRLGAAVSEPVHTSSMRM